jgi:uncharacterized protein YjbI with pentapeptide repeats
MGFFPSAFSPLKENYKEGICMINMLQILNSKSVFYVLIFIAVVSLVLSGWSHQMAGGVNWWSWFDGAFQNFSTEMMGAIVTFGFFDLVVGARKEREAKEEAIAEKRKFLIIQMRSQDNATALNAVEQLRNNAANSFNSPILKRHAKALQPNNYALTLINKDLDGAELQGAQLEHSDFKLTHFRGANLSHANLRNTNLTNATLQHTNLQGADLSEARLQGANLMFARLQGANLERSELQGARLLKAKFNEETVLPDAIYQGTKDGKLIFDKYWTSETNMGRYTNPEHKDKDGNPDFWQPDWEEEQDE